MAISKRLRHNVLRRDRFACRYCRSQEHPLEVDHVIPRSRGGQDVFENLVAACQPCNLGKTDTLPDDGLVLAVRDETRAWEEAQPRRRPVMVTGTGRVMTESQIRRDERERLNTQAAELHGPDIEFWVLFNQERPELHTAMSPCISSALHFCLLLDNEVQGADRAWAQELATSEPMWCELRDPEDGADISLWDMPAEFCDKCCPADLVRLNRNLPEWMLLGQRAQELAP